MPFQPYLFQQLQRALFSILSLYTAQRHAQLDVLNDAKVRDQVVVLENKADGAVAVGVPVTLLEVLCFTPFDDDFAPVGMVQPANDVQAGGLARPAGAEDRYEFFLPERYIDIVQSYCFDSSRTIGFGYILKFQHLRHFLFLPWSICLHGLLLCPVIRID